MPVSVTSSQFYSYNGSLLDLYAGSLLGVSILNSGTSVGTGTLTDNNGQLSQADDGSATFTLNGVTQPIDYQGAGTVGMFGIFGIQLDSRPVAVFSVGGNTYLYAPNGLPLLSALTISFNVSASNTFTLSATANGEVDGLDTDQTMVLGYTDLQGDRITVGNDIINANAGNDSVDAAAGNDTVSGGTGNDTVFGNAGDDSLLGGTGSDLLSGGDGNDRIDGGADADTISGDLGNDVLTGGAGADSLLGGDGNDTLDGGTEQDTLSGGNGRDSLSGGAGNDSLLGGEGDDTIDGGDGNDVIVEGGAAATSRSFSWVNGFDGSDPLLGASQTLINGAPGVTNVSGDANTDNEFVFVQANTTAKEAILAVNPGLTGAESVNTVTVSLTLDMGSPSGSDHVDGFSVSFGDVSTITTEEENGVGEGLAIRLDPLANIAEIRWNGAVVSSLSVSNLETRGVGTLSVLVTNTGVVSVTLPTSGSVNLTGTIPNGEWATADQSGWQFAFAGRTGSNAGMIYMDDVNISAGISAPAATGGNDAISGGLGQDTISGGFGQDTIDGGAGNDMLSGGDGDDTIFDGAGNDTVYGGAGNDLIDDALGYDSTAEAGLVYGEAGNDTIWGSAGGDTLDGGADDDQIGGDGGNDSILGGAGNDTLTGAAGIDTLAGGVGADQFVVDGTADRITDFDALTGVQGTTGAPTADNDFVNLSSFYNAANLAVWNAANPGQTFGNALAWMQADQRDDGVLQNAGGLTILNGGAAVDAALFNAENTAIICFARGTRILTVQGERAIEDLVAGDLVQTVDHGHQPVRWIGSTTVPAIGALAPIIFDAGALGNTRPLRVSPQHRMVLTGWQAELLFEDAEVLVAAKLLVNDQSIRRHEGGQVEYFHMLFDAHELVWADGALSESFHPGHVGWGALADAARQEILTLFPDLDGMQFESYGPSARRSLTAHEARILAQDMQDHGDSLRCA